jgi:hypothetical protein
MNVIEFVLEKPPAERDALSPVVNVRIDGRLLADIMKDFEMPMAKREGHPDIAGGYEAIGKPEAPEDYYLGVEPAWKTEGADKTVLLDCKCGSPGCWPLLCVIETNDSEVIWRNFEQPHRALGSAAGWWDYSEFLGFTFDKAQYLDALSALRGDA